MLKYVTKLNSVYCVLIAIAVYALMSLGKLVAGFILLVAVIAVLVRYARSISLVFNKLFTRGDK